MKKLFVVATLLLLFCQLHAAPPKDVHSTALRTPDGWRVDSIAEGLIWHNYTGYYAPTKCNQTVNVLEIAADYQLKIVDRETADSLSSFALAEGAVAGINGSYFESEVSFVKTDGQIRRQVTLSPDHVRFWKHEGALFYDPKTREIKIAYGTNADYALSDFPNVLSGAPMLIEAYRPVGVDFTGNIDSIDLKSLDYEDYRRHQGVRHPRVAIAVMEDGRVLLVTVDGRWKSSEGMSAAELTQFLVRNFNPKYALNLDGGGSTTMWIADRGTYSSNVVNFPTDNKRYDHFGQRPVNNVILVMKLAVPQKTKHKR